MQTTDANPQVAKTEIVLSAEQEHAVSLIRNWYLSEKRTKPTFKLGGYAGTGKTTVIKAILANARIRIVVCAFTGKACNVLTKKGVDAITMHSLLYECHEEDRELVFERRNKLEYDPHLIIVDEASMVSTELYNDLMSFGVPVLFVGDPGQLEPVGDNPNLMKECNYVLQTIHRQAANSLIITLANSIRNGGIFTRVSSDALVIKDKPLTDSDFVSASCVLVARNNTRHDFNQRYRAIKGWTGQKLLEGEKIIVLRNNARIGVFNGMILFVRKITAEYETLWYCDCEDETGKKFTKLRIWKTPFQRKLSETDRLPKEYVLADYAYAITVHKSQGSEWDDVVVYDEWMKGDMARWRYTAITRAAKKLTYLIGR